MQEIIPQSGFPAFPLKYSCKYLNAIHACQNFRIFMNHSHLNSAPCIFISVSASLRLLSNFELHHHYKCGGLVGYLSGHDLSFYLALCCEMLLLLMIVLFVFSDKMNLCQPLGNQSIFGSWVHSNRQCPS